MPLSLANYEAAAWYDKAATAYEEDICDVRIKKIKNEILNWRQKRC